MIDPSDGQELAGSSRGSVAGLAGASYFALLIGLVTSPLIARAVGPAGRGEIASATVYLALATTAVGMGVPLAVGHAAANRLYPIGSVLATAVRFCWMTAPVTVGLVLIALVGPARHLSTPAKVGTGALILTAPVGVLTFCLGALLVARGDLRSLGRVQAFPALCLGTGIIVAYLTGGLTVATYLAIMFATVILSAVVAWRALGVRRAAAMPMKPLVKFGLRGYAGYFAVTGSLRIDQAFIGPLLGSRALGIYAVSAALSILPFTLARAVGSRAFAKVASADVDGRDEVMSHYLRLTVLASALVSLAIGVVSPLAVPLLYGRAFSDVVGPLLIMLPGVVALCASGTASACLSAVGRPGETTLAEMCGFGLTLVGVPFVVPAFGLPGAAALSSFTYATTFVAYRCFLRRLGPVRFWPGRREVIFMASALKHGLPVAKIIRRG